MLYNYNKQIWLPCFAYIITFKSHSPKAFNKDTVKNLFLQFRKLRRREIKALVHSHHAIEMLLQARLKLRS